MYSRSHSRWDDGAVCTRVHPVPPILQWSAEHHVRTSYPSSHSCCCLRSTVDLLPSRSVGQAEHCLRIAHCTPRTHARIAMPSSQDTRYDVVLDTPAHLRNTMEHEVRAGGDSRMIGCRLQVPCSGFAAVFRSSQVAARSWGNRR